MTRHIEGLDKPIGSVIQYAYTVEDLDAEIVRYVDVFGIGPWFVTGPFSPPEARYRGEPTSMTVTLARAFSGNAMIELVKQHDEEPSVYQEVISRRGHGFHHWAIGSDDIAADIARFATKGYPVAFEDRLPSGARIVYVDATADFPGMIEIVEFTPAQERTYVSFFQASVGWDGSDPIRRT